MPKNAGGENVFFVSLLKNRPDACVSNAVDLSYRPEAAVGLCVENICGAKRLMARQLIFADLFRY